MAINTTLQDESGEDLYPLSLMGNIYSTDGTSRLDQKLDNMDSATSDKATSSNVAAIEATMTATSAHAKGSYVYIKSADSLYRVTSAISAGNTMAVGTNIVKTTVGSELSQLNSDIANIIGINIDSGRSVNDLPSTYPIGLSLTTVGSSTDFPYNYATVITFKAHVNYGTQFIAKSNGSAAQMRTISNASSWNAWHTISVT